MAMKSKGLFTIIVLALLALALSACAPAAAPSPTPAPKATVTSAAKETPKPAAAAPAATITPMPLEKINIQVPAKVTIFMHLYFGKEKGIFKDFGLDPEIVVLKGDLAVPALLKGDVDYLNTFGRPLQAALMGEPVRLVMVNTSKATWHIVLGPGINTAEQLKGKPFAIAMKGGTDHYASVVGIRRLGLDPDKDVTFVVIPDYPNMLVALKSGAVSGAGLIPPESNRAVAQGFKEALFTGDILEIPSDGLATTLKRLQENPGQVKQVMKAILKTMAYVKDHKDEVVQYVMKDFSLDKEVADAVVTDQIKVWAYDGSVSDQGLSAFLDTMKAGGGPLKDTTLEQVKKGVDFTLLKDVQKELNMSR